MSVTVVIFDFKHLPVKDDNGECEGFVGSQNAEEAREKKNRFITRHFSSSSPPSAV